jgi:hypothetical protein
MADHQERALLLRLMIVIHDIAASGDSQEVHSRVQEIGVQLRKDFDVIQSAI